MCKLSLNRGGVQLGNWKLTLYIKKKSCRALQWQGNKEGLTKETGKPGRLVQKPAE